MGRVFRLRLNICESYLEVADWSVFIRDSYWFSLDPKNALANSVTVCTCVCPVYIFYVWLSCKFLNRDHIWYLFYGPQSTDRSPSMCLTGYYRYCSQERVAWWNRFRKIWIIWSLAYFFTLSVLEGFMNLQEGAWLEAFPRHLVTLSHTLVFIVALRNNSIQLLANTALWQCCVRHIVAAQF